MKKKDDTKDELEKRLTALSKSFHIIKNSLLEEADTLYVQENSYYAALNRCSRELEAIVSTSNQVQIETLQKQISVDSEFFKRRQDMFDNSCHAFFKEETVQKDKLINKSMDQKIIFAYSIFGEKILYYFPQKYKRLMMDSVNIHESINGLSMPTIIVLTSAIKAITVIDKAFKSDEQKIKGKISTLEKNIIELESMILELQDLRFSIVKREYSIMLVLASLQSLIISNLPKNDADLLINGTLLRHMEYASSSLKES